MRYLVVSDLHGNWEALQAVLLDARGNYEKILCLGDLAGYGPDPNRVIEWAREFVHAGVRGNHDRACAGMENLEWFNPVARISSLWTRAQLTEENLAYLRELPEGPLQIDDLLLVHGSPLDEDEYLITDADARNVFPYLEANLAFFGHTHLQGGFAWRHGRIERIASPASFKTRVDLQVDPEGAYLLNPGSVGQPRDRDRRAAYGIYDDFTRRMIFCRTTYEDRETRGKIVAAGLPDILAERLKTGR